MSLLDALKEIEAERRAPTRLEMIRTALDDAGIAFASDVRVQPSALRDKELVVIDIRHHEISFDELTRISKALGTTRINLDSQVREGGYCETCRYSYTITVLTAWDVVLPEN